MLPGSPNGMLKARPLETSVLMKKQDETFIMTVGDFLLG